MVIGDLNLQTISESRATGTVLPLLDSRRTTALVQEPEVVTL